MIFERNNSFILLSLITKVVSLTLFPDKPRLLTLTNKEIFSYQIRMEGSEVRNGDCDRKQNFSKHTFLILKFYFLKTNKNVDLN